LPKAPDPADHALRLNPYYGYMARPGMRLADVTRRNAMVNQFGASYVERDHERVVANKHGFVSIHDYPFTDPNAFVIGVFGGSVAVQFALTMAPTLQEHLSSHPKFTGRRVVLLNFANGGTKQPQQLTTLAYFLTLGQKFDLILNLDGFNELFIGWYNAMKHEVDESMPFARFMTGVQNYVLESRTLLAGENRVSGWRTRLNEIADALARPQFALAALWLQVEAKRLTASLIELENKLAAPASVATQAVPLLPRSSADNDASREMVVRAWINGSLGMAGMAREFDTPYLHVLQPNQYFSKAKFTEEQRKTVLALQEPPVASLVPAHYRVYLERADILKKKGIEFLDATGVFDTSDGSVFHDNCCHFNEAGNKLLAAAIAHAIKGALDRHSSAVRAVAPH
jgi:hypothetical protein